jgi:hypothetical protein
MQKQPASLGLKVVLWLFAIAYFKGTYFDAKKSVKVVWLICKID